MGGESLGLQQYTARVREASRAWRDLSQEDKQAFEVEANHQETLRAELSVTPLSVGSKAKERTDLEEAVGRKSCKLLSARRLKLNDEQFDHHSLWDLLTCLCDSTSSVSGKNCLLSPLFLATAFVYVSQ